MQQYDKYVLEQHSIHLDICHHSAKYGNNKGTLGDSNACRFVGALNYSNVCTLALFINNMERHGGDVDQRHVNYPVKCTDQCEMFNVCRLELTDLKMKCKYLRMVFLRPVNHSFIK